MKVDTSLDQKVKLPLFTLRVGVFIVMFMWVIDKFLNPVHTASVWDRYYNIENIGTFVSYAAGVIQGSILFAFLLGLAKRYSYGLIFIMHLISTISPISKYLNPFQAPNLLFFAAFPMLSACFALYVLRDNDALLSPFSKT